MILESATQDEIESPLKTDLVKK
ncbi:hypothetical protein Goshw_028125 [Gossypium schwendimanii]|uniref:Uncharacterized protein n=1 Tax=Gossypium schwendimanii TaxID=34291 RepID=A0A7J9MQB4_GOSSC|nr:hypothetical protein [Gossypium schwendimanii]